MRIVFAGTPDFAVPSLRTLVDVGHDVVGAITREDAPLGRKRVLTQSPVAVAAAELGIPVLKTNRLGDEASEWVGSLAPDLGVIVAYGALVRDPLLTLPALGWINLHFSELPRWRGAAPVQRALQAGEQRLGVTVFRLVEALDAGAVLTRDTKEFAPGTCAGEALTDLALFGTGALQRAVDALSADAAAGEPQQGEASYAHKLTREDGRLDLTRPVAEVLAHWAGVTPEPGAFAMHDGQPLKLCALTLPPIEPAGEPEEREAFDGSAGDASTAAHGAKRGVEIKASGAVTLEDGAAILHLSGGALELEKVQPAGKPVMDGAAWLRGRGGEAVLT